MLLVAPPATFCAPLPVLFAPETPDVTCFAATFPPGYFFAPMGVFPVNAAAFVDAGLELDRLTTGLRAVDGRALPEGVYDCPESAVP